MITPWYYQNSLATNHSPTPSVNASLIGLCVEEDHHLRALATETAGKLDVLGLDGDTLGVNSAQVGVFEEGDEVSLNGFLEGTDGG